MSRERKEKTYQAEIYLKYLLKPTRTAMKKKLSFSKNIDLVVPKYASTYTQINKRGNAYTNLHLYCLH